VTSAAIPLLERRRVLLFDGESEAASLSDHLVDVVRQFKERDFDPYIIDLKSPSSTNEVNRELSSGRVRFSLGLSGYGSDLSVSFSGGSSSVWTYLRAPFVGIMPDTPVFHPLRHRLASPWALLLYSDAIHLEIAQTLGPSTTPKGLIGQAGIHSGIAPGPIGERDIPILYAKAGGDPEQVRASWRAVSAKQRELVSDVVEACCWITDTSIWHVARERVRAEHLAEGFEQSDGFCWIVMQAELYIRRARATRALESLLHLPVRVTGGDWAHLNWKSAKAQLVPRVSLAELRALFERSQIVLNAMPALRHSTHHRVIEGMLAGAAVASDTNSWLDANVGRDRYIAFDWSSGAVAESVATALADPTALQATADGGRAFALGYHNPVPHFDRMLSTIDTFIAMAQVASADA
jgi:hypothetical protein